MSLIQLKVYTTKNRFTTEPCILWIKIKNKVRKFILRTSPRVYVSNFKEKKIPKRFSSTPLVIGTIEPAEYLRQMHPLICAEIYEINNSYYGRSMNIQNQFKARRRDGVHYGYLHFGSYLQDIFHVPDHAHEICERITAQILHAIMKTIKNKR